MQPNDIITLNAFLIALTQLEDKSLPAEIQTQLNAIGKALAAAPTNLGNLDVIAERYKPLDTVYQEALTALRQEASQRNKGLPPLPLSNKPTQEITNMVIDTFSADDSVAAAKKATQPKNPLKRIWLAIRGIN